MQAIKRLVGWLGGTALLYVMLVLAILAGAFVGPWLVAQWQTPARQIALADRLDAEVVRPLTAERELTQRRVAAFRAEAAGRARAELDNAIAANSTARTQIQGQRRKPAAKALSLARGDSAALIEDGKRELQIQVLDAQIATLTAARDRIDLKAAADAARRACHEARIAFEISEARWEVRATLGLYDQTQRRVLTDQRNAACERSKQADRRQIDAEDDRGEQQIREVTGDIKAFLTKTRIAAQGTAVQRASLWAEQVHLSKVLWQAGLALISIMVAPYLIRLFCYFVLAPAAMRRPAIRVGAARANSAAIPTALHSAASVEVRLAPGEELLVRHGYLQSSSDRGVKATQWFLDIRHPITSLATGLTFLTRVRGDGEVTNISAVRDPFAEVSVLTLPDGASCVLQPRALAAVSQPIGQRLRVTAHWRLWSLNAWLTLQLRYLVFHGPVRLVLKGGRGIRVERAERGRILGQDQVVGFSTDLAYSVTRNETFWPYFIGREPLLRDRVAAGDGVLIIEEAPMTGGRSGKPRRGIEGMIDATMKVFGL